ncbi:MAG: hypothetical protein VB085_08910 [Peptococcaceae bacterium]|nr:hypothetical protein [Peptococcaceae bacterium]
MSIETEALGIESPEVGPEIEAVPEPMPEQISLFSWLADAFRVETGAGEIKDYQDSPLCFDGSVGLGQMLRGVAGFAGANFLRSALLDVIVGAMRWAKGLKPDA